MTFAGHWAGNSTVIGFDLRNEPCAHTRTPALWGGQGPTDIHAMYEAVGNAILEVNPDALIICESIINYKLDAYEGGEHRADQSSSATSSPSAATGGPGAA